jgi:L-ascorbate metabolism protein UlaG (beta-lactamase superfamily)
MNVTYYGHACFSVEVGGRRLLFDPYISQNPLAKSVDIKQIPADYIFITHGHGDHIGDAAKIAKRTKATVVANFEVAQWLQKKGVQKVHPLNPGGSVNFEFGSVKSVNAVHSSSMPDGTYGGSPSGFVMESREGNFYYSGDTALTTDMQLISETTKLKFAALCIGGNFTMGVADAIRAAKFIKCKEILGVHFDTFPEIEINHARAQEKFRASGKTLHLLRIGAIHNFD